MVEQVLTDRQKKLWSLVEFGKGRGLEIGPLHNAVVPRSAGDVRYVDVFTRAELLANYADDPLVDVSLIPETDFLLVQDGAPVALDVAVAPAAPYDWVVASHVVEHVPDLVQWLDELATVVVDGGELLLIVPDRRYTFDVHRPQTTVGQMLAAHDRRDVRPTVGSVYDYHRTYLWTTAPELWQGVVPGPEARRFTDEEVRAAVERARAGEYVDCHVWTFTPASFVTQVVELRELGLIPWEVGRLLPTPEGMHEFYVVLRRRPRGAEQAAGLTEMEQHFASDHPDWEESARRDRLKVRELWAAIGRRDEQIERLRGVRAEQRARIQRLRAKLGQSKS